MSFEDRVRMRDEMVEGVRPWLWPIEDTGAWDGPSREFGSLRDKMMAHARERQVVIQAGGCCGMYPRLWAERFQRVYTFEPDPLSFHCLVNNCQSKNIHKFNAALGQSSEMLWLNGIENVSNVGMHTVSEVKDTELSVPVIQMTIDSLGLEQCDIIQLDIEGYEINALLGGFNTITRCRPVIACENGKTDDIKNFMQLVSYKEVDTNSADTIYAPM